MKITQETCTGTLHRDTDGRWYAKTQLVGKAYLDKNIQQRPDPNVEGVEVEVVLTGMGTSRVVTDYHFI